MKSAEMGAGVQGHRCASTASITDTRMNVSSTVADQCSTPLPTTPNSATTVPQNATAAVLDR